MNKWSSCPIATPVRVRAYPRFRKGRWEMVTTHCRGLPTR